MVYIPRVGRRHIQQGSREASLCLMPPFLPKEARGLSAQSLPFFSLRRPEASLRRVILSPLRRPEASLRRVTLLSFSLF